MAVFPSPCGFLLFLYVLVVITSKRENSLLLSQKKKKKNSPKCVKADRESEICWICYYDSFQYLRSGEGAFKMGWNQLSELVFLTRSVCVCFGWGSTWLPQDTLAVLYIPYVLSDPLCRSGAPGLQFLPAPKETAVTWPYRTTPGAAKDNS